MFICVYRVDFTYICMHMYTDSLFSLVVVVMFYQVAVNTELVNANCKFRCLQISGHSIFIS